MGSAVDIGGFAPSPDLEELILGDALGPRYRTQKPCTPLRTGVKATSEHSKESMMKLLFICTHNRCRSILCEAIANQRGEGVLQAASAGSAPAASVHPLTLRYLTERGYETAGLVSQSWHDLEAFEPGPGHYGV